MKLLFILVLLAAAPCLAAPNAKPAGEPWMQLAVPEAVKGTKIDFHGVLVSQVVSVVYAEMLMQPYVIDPAVLKDDRTVSFRFDSSKGDIRVFWRTFLDSLGFGITVRGGVDYVGVKVIDERTELAREAYIYRTKFRSVSYLVDLLSPLFKPGAFLLNRAVRAPAGDKVAIGANPSSSPGSAASMIDQDTDTMVFQGTPGDIAKLEKLLAQVDVAIGEVMIKAVVYEVTTGKTDGTAFSLAANILGGKVGLSIGGSSELTNAVTFKGANIEAAFSALSGDSRFKAVSTPSIRVKSGLQARLVVGQDVPTLGAVTVPQGGGQALQSIEYRSSGVILGLSPTVRSSGVEVVVDQQISDFARTETGVNSSPTLTKRSLMTTVTVGEDELIILGGLTQDKNAISNSGLSFLPKFLRTSSDTDSRTEFLLFMQVSKLSP